MEKATSIYVLLGIMALMSAVIVVALLVGPRSSDKTPSFNELKVAQIRCLENGGSWRPDMAKCDY
jgi:hypothetical protein